MADGSTPATREDRWCAAYLAGTSLSALARGERISPHKIRRALISRGVPLRRGVRRAGERESRTIDVLRLPQRDLRAGTAQFPLHEWDGQRHASGLERPRVFGDCERDGWGALRPCPFVACRYHLALDIQPSGHIRLAFGSDDLEAWASRPHCALRHCADEATLDDVGGILGMTRERIRQIELDAIRAMRTSASVAGVGP